MSAPRSTRSATVSPTTCRPRPAPSPTPCATCPRSTSIRRATSPCAATPTSPSWSPAGPRHDVALQAFDRVRERLDPVTGAVISTTRQSQDVEGDVDVQFGRLTAEYRLTDNLQLTGELRGNLIDTGGRGLEVYETDNAAGAPVSAYTRDGDFGFDGDNVGATARLLRRFGE